MLRLRSVFAAVSLSVLCCACSSRLDSAEVAGGRVLVYSKGAVESERALTTGQVAGINSWLAAHQDGWELDTASYAPEVLAYLEGRGGQSIGLYVYDQSVIYVSGSYQRARQSKVDETRALKQALGVPDAG